MSQDNIKFLAFDEHHLKLIKAWHKEPHVIEFWGNPNFEESYEEYVMNSSSDGTVVQFLIEFESNSVGYIQYYWASKVGDGWWEGYPDDIVGFDFYIGESSWLGKGIGEKIIKCFSEFLFKIPEVNLIIADPSPKNSKVIHILEKCDFNKKQKIVTPDGEAILYQLERSFFLEKNSNS